MHITVETHSGCLVWHLSGVLGGGRDLVARARGTAFPPCLELRLSQLVVRRVFGLFPLWEVICIAKRKGAHVVVRAPEDIASVLRLAQFDLLCSIKDLTAS